MKAKRIETTPIVGLNIEGKTVVIKSSSLKPEFDTYENRVGVATDGFGCNPRLTGTAVLITFADGHSERWERYDIEGILADGEVM